MVLTAEQHVLKLLKDANRPFNVQLVVDAMQKHGIKKAQVQKALDGLADKGEITTKVLPLLLVFGIRARV